MISAFEGLSATRVVGLAAYACAVAGCAWRWRDGRRWEGQRRAGSAGAFGVLAVVQMVLLLDIAFNLRWKLHEFFMQEAMSHGLYAMRRPPQRFALWILAGVATLGCALIVSRFYHRRGVALAVTGTLLSVTLRCAEVLSYHGLDAVLYHTVGRVMLVSAFWAGLTLLTLAGVWIDEVDACMNKDGTYKPIAYKSM